MSELTHLDANGNAVMVDVGEKQVTRRQAIAVGRITMNADCFAMVAQRRAKKGDVLGVAESDIALLAGVLAVVAVVWLTLHNSMLLTSVNADWARSRGIGTRAVECAFAALMAVVVMLSIQWIGTLLINSMLILPAAAARNLARNSRQYALTAVVLSVISGVTGLILSFYLNTSAGAAIVLCSAALYFVTLLMRTVTHR